MSRNLSQLKAEVELNKLTVKSVGRVSKASYEEALRNFYWKRDHPFETMAPQLHPMLARNIKDLDPETAEYMWNSTRVVAQEKVDGCRLLQFIGELGSSFTSRRISDRTYRYSENTDQLPHLRRITSPELVGAVLDGEVICMRHDVDTGAVITRNGLQATVALLAIDPKESERIQREQNAWLVYRVFDILAGPGGVDLTGQPYEKRFAELLRVVELLKKVNPDVMITVVPLVTLKKKEFYETMVRAGAEGVMLKSLDAPYEASSSRTKAMYKVKKFEEHDLFVTGFVKADEDKGWDRLIGGLELSAWNVGPDGNRSLHLAAVPINMTLEERIAATSCRHCGERVVAVTANDLGKRVVVSVDCATHGVMAPDSIGLHSSMLNRVYVVRGQEFSARVFRLKHAVVMSERFDKDPDSCEIDLASIQAKFDSKGSETGIKL